LTKHENKLNNSLQKKKKLNLGSIIIEEKRAKNVVNKV
jgi:hypothetical protein